MPVPETPLVGATRSDKAPENPGGLNIASRVARGSWPEVAGLARTFMGRRSIISAAQELKTAHDTCSAGLGVQTGCCRHT